MAKKNLLNEAQVKRFQSLASIAPLTPINEMYGKVMDEMKDETDTRTEKEKAEDQEAAERRSGGGQYYGEVMHGEKKEAMHNEEMHDDAEEMPADEEAEEMADADADGDVDLEEGDVEKLLAAFDAAMDVVEKLRGALGAEEREEEMEDVLDVDMAPEAPEEVEMEMGSDLMETKEIVEEVARRVAKRLNEAKRAQAALDKALGTKNTK
jgi:hypothetical protein